MADALVAAVLQQLALVAYQEIHQEVRLVVGAEADVQKLMSTLRTIKAVLADAEKRQVTEDVVTIWLENLKDISYDMDDVVDEWSTAIIKRRIQGIEAAPIPMKKKVWFSIPSPFFCFSPAAVLSKVVLRHDIARKIKELNERLDVIASEPERYSFKIGMSAKEPKRHITTSFVDVFEVYGRDLDKETIVNKLLHGNSQQERGLPIISIVGMGGIGKTTLAQLAYNDDDVKSHFVKRIWVCVSDPFDEVRIGRAIARALDGVDCSLEWENLPQHIHQSIKGKKFLLVLDDVWTEDFKRWESLEHCLKSGAKGSRILMTTRNERVAKMMGTTYTHSMVELSQAACRSLFNWIAFFGRSQEDRVKLEEIGSKIADKCKGLPLAVKTLGSLMRFKETEEDWQNVLNSEWWELEEVEKRLFPPLLLSYYDLPLELKRCFSYCAVFPKDCVIQPDKLIELWMAQGYLRSTRSSEMELIGGEYFRNLVMRSFFQDLEVHGDGRSISTCKIHDIVHDFAQFLMRNECSIVEVGVNKEMIMEQSYRKVRHSTVVFHEKASFPTSIYNRENSHSFFFISEVIGVLPIDLHGLFYHLKCLRALDLSGGELTDVSAEVGNLMHMRYLNLSHNEFEELPETVCNLCNLLTLDVSFCENLKKLPVGMGKLINLRHLKIQGSGQILLLPKGIGKLSSLRMITHFIVSGANDQEACQLEDLKYLNNLKWDLTIKGLGRVENVDEAEKAELMSKKQLLGLTLNFSPGETKGRKLNDIVEALKPPSNLEFLSIWNCVVTLPPKWMLLLTKLKKLVLCACEALELLPTLGKLPFLESFEARSNVRLIKVGIDFLGIDVDDVSTASQDDRTEPLVIVAFPKLKELTFHHMEAWKEWDGVIKKKKDADEISIMPCLRSLKIEYCSKLQALPQYIQTMPLKELTISGCRILKRHYQEGMREDWAKISHIPKIKITD